MQAVTSDVTLDVSYAPYLFSGTVQLEGVKYPTRILRDTGSSISLWVKPNHVDVGGDEFILIKGVTGALTVPLLECDVVCDLYSGKARVGVVDNLPEDGVDLILGNDLVRGDDVSVPVLTRVPVSTNVNKENNVIDLEVFPACAVTRSMFREEERRREEGTAQARMKRRYDEKAQPREFQVGEEVLALLPLQGKFLAAQCSGSYVVERRVGEVDYVVKTPDRVPPALPQNMLKPYHRLPGIEANVQHVITVAVGDDDAGCEVDVACDLQDCSWSENEDLSPRCSPNSTIYLVTRPTS